MSESHVRVTSEIGALRSVLLDGLIDAPIVASLSGASRQRKPSGEPAGHGLLHARERNVAGKRALVACPYTPGDCIAEKYVLEELIELQKRCQFIALPLRIDGADGSPVRAIALVE